MSVEPQNTRIKRLERLLEVGRNLSAMLDLEPLLQTIIDAAADLTYCQEASILIYDPDERDLKFAAAPWFKREQMREVRVPISNSIAGQVFRYGEPILVQDAKTDPRIFREVDLTFGFKTSSLLAVPMKIKNETTGVLTAVNKINEQAFSQEDIQVLETLATQAAIAIHNANLLTQTQRAYEDMAQLDQMKSDFIAITSHELRTPLGLILGHATFMHEMVPDDLKTQMDVIVRSAVRLKDIVDDLSKVNNFQTGQTRIRKGAVNISELLEELVKSFRNEAKEREVELKLELPEGTLLIEGDAEKLGIALSHLIRNAIAFTDAGGGVVVEAAKAPEFVRIDVSDTGIGIPEEDVPRVFERFYQVEAHMTRRHGGMGLGLSVAKMMVEMHRGRIGVHSIEGEGSIFSILLPLPTADLNTTPPFLGEKED